MPSAHSAIEPAPAPVVPARIDSPLLIARFDRQLQCQALSTTWRDRLLPGAAADKFVTLFNPQLAQQAQQTLDTGEPAHAELPLFATCICRYRVDLWREESDGEPVLMALAQAVGDLPDNPEFELLRTQNLSILGAAGEGIYGVDKNGCATFANAASARILGWQPDEVIGIRTHDVHHHSHPDGSHYDRQDCPIYAALKDGEIHRVDDEVFWHKDGHPVPVEYISTPIVQGGEIQGAVIVFRDISERKQAEQQQSRAFEEIKQLKEELEQERDYLRNEIDVTANFGEIIGHSPALQRTMAQIDAVADTPSSVLILGESGVGKEMIARAIHNKSARSQGPLVKVNCASIPKELFESEFFGHLKGAFTGAHRDRVGRLQLANGGTLFLDEVGEIPLDLQGKLLRALQEQEFERVGDDRTTRVDVRIVAATNRDLAKEVNAGRFREDLYYRLSVFPISVPPLRERQQDIPPLAQHFICQSRRELGREVVGLSSRQLETLSRHDWPGNIRELKNVIERAVILSKEGRLRLDLAMPDTVADPAVPAVSNLATPTGDAEELPSAFVTDAEFRQLEKENLQRALVAADWKIAGESGAAALLGLKPSTLTYRMGVLGIKKPR